MEQNAIISPLQSSVMTSAALIPLPSITLPFTLPPPRKPRT